jgi:hypothetical protein
MAHNNIVVSAKGEGVRIRFPKGVLKQLGQAAAQSGRSRNSEIVYRLVTSLNQDKKTA